MGLNRGCQIPDMAAKKVYYKYNYFYLKLIELKACCPISGLTKEMTSEWGGRKKRGTVWSVVNPTKMGQWHPFE